MTAPFEPDAGQAAEAGTVDVSELIYRDELTNLYNRRYMREFLAREIAWDDESAGPVSVLMIDVDHFKEINDHHGHLVGDAVLVHVAQVLRSSFRGSYLVIRYAGDEFIAILPGTDNPTAVMLAERTLKRLVDAKYVHEESAQEISVSMSVGIATFPDDTRDPDHLIEKADNALYTSKHEGRGRATRASEQARKTLTEEEILQRFPCPSMIGRQEPLQRLRGYLPVEDPRPATTVVITGESGVGKTRLIAEFINLTQKQGLTWLVDRGLEVSRQTPYYVLGAFVKQLIAQYPGLVGNVLAETDPKQIRCLIEEIPELARCVPPTKPIGTVADSEKREVLFESYVDLLSRISMLAPVAMFMDEFQHVDIGTLSVLLALHGRKDTRLSAFGALTAASLKDPGLEGTPLGNFCQFVSSESDALFVEVPLQPLGREAVSEIVTSLFPGRGESPEFDDALYQLSRGNPLHLEAALKDMVGRGLIQQVDDQWRLELPPEEGWPTTIDDTIRSRLGRLDPETAELLARAAVIGPNFGLEVLKAITGANTGYALELLDRAKRAAVVAPVPGREDEELSFVNPHVREVVYEKLDPEERKATHQRIAEEVSDQSKHDAKEAASLLAFHFNRAGDAAKAQQFEQKVLAHAKDIFDFDNALAFMRKKMGGKLREGDEPLSAEALVHLNATFELCLKGIEFLSDSSTAAEASARSTRAICSQLKHVFGEVDIVTVKRENSHFRVNGAWVGPMMFGKATKKFFDLLQRREGQGITLTSSVRESEIEQLLEALAKTTMLSGKWRWDAWRGAGNVWNIYVDQRIEKGEPVEATGPAPTVQAAPPPKPKPKPSLRHVAPQKDKDSEFSIEKVLPAETVLALKDLVKRYAVMNHTPALRHIMAIIEERSSLPKPDMRLQAYQILGDLLDLAELSNSELLLGRAALTVQCRFGAEEAPDLLSTLARNAQKAVAIAMRLRNLDLAERIIWALRRESDSRRIANCPLTVARDELCEGEVLETLIHDLHSDDGKRRRAAGSAIVGLGEPAVQRLIDALKLPSSLRFKKTVAQALSKIGSATGRDVLDAISPTAPAEECDALIGVFQALAKNLRRDIRLAVDHPNPIVRAHALRLLTGLGEDWAAQMLSDLVASGNTPTAVEALKAIGEAGSAEIGSRLLTIAPSLEDEDLEAECYRTLGKLRCDTALDVLERASSRPRFFGLIKGRSEPVREAAIWAIEQIKNGPPTEARR